MAVLLLMLGLFAWLIMAGRSTATTPALFPDQDLSTLGQGGNFIFFIVFLGSRVRIHSRGY